MIATANLRPIDMHTYDNIKDKELETLSKFFANLK